MNTRLKKVFLFLLFLINSLFSDAQYYDWARYFGQATAFSIKHDNAYNLYTCGFFEHTIDFNPFGTSMTLTAQGIGDIFVIKHNALGAVDWVKTMGAPGSGASAIALSLDIQKNIILTGYFSDSVDFDPGAGTYFLHAYYPVNNFFIEKLDSNGNFLWAKTYKVHSLSNGSPLVTDAVGNIYVSGFLTDTVNFNPGGSGGQAFSNGMYYNFILKLDALGNFRWVDITGGYGGCQANSIAIDNEANIYTTGTFGDTIDFDPGIGTYFLGPNKSIFLQKLDSAGHLVWAKAFGGNSGEGMACDIDNSGNCLVTGYNLVGGDFDPGPDSLIFPLRGMFTLKFSNSGNLIWGNYIHDAEILEPHSITHDAYNNVYRTGYFDNFGIDFDPSTTGVYQLPFNGDGGAGSGAGDIFIDKLDSNGNFKWARDIGGTEDDMGYGIITGENESVTICGNFTGEADLDPGAANTHSIAFGSGQDALILKLDTTCPPVTITATGVNLGITSLYSVLPLAPPYCYWVNCITGDTVGYGVDLMNYTATVNGTYALIFQNDFCTTKSNCVAVSSVDVNDLPKHLEIIKVYHMPATNQVTIVWNTTIQITAISVYNTIGQKFEVPYQIRSAKMMVDCSKLLAGNYIIAITGINGEVVTKQITVNQ